MMNGALISGTDDLPDSQLLRLPDGRRLGFAQYGAREGRPLLFFHGTPGARLQARIGHASALRLNVRLIAPERPGFGRSDFQAGRLIAQWPDDVAALADALGLDRFAVAGVSGGGPYALACACRLPDRIRIVGVVSGMTPLAGPRDPAALALAQRLIFAAMRRAPWMLRGGLALTAPALRRWPLRLLDLMGTLAPAADGAILAQPEIRAALVDDLRAALRAGSRGAAHELALFGRPWGVRLAETRVPVVLWHGEADNIVPVAHARRLARQIPHCNAHFLAGAGHFWLLEHSAEVIAALCPR